MDVYLKSGRMATRRLVLNMKKLEKAKTEAIKFIKDKGYTEYTIIDIGTSVAIYY